MFKIFLFFCFSFLMLSCSKEVSTNSTDLNSRKNPVIEVPSNQNNGTISLTFANHATVNEPDDELSVISLSEPLLLSMPTFISSISFQSSVYKPNLTLTVNNISVCVYSWSQNQYSKTQGCYAELDLTPNDDIKLFGVPKSQTVTIQMQYQR